MTPAHVRAARLACGYTLDDLASLSDVHRQTIYLWESGQRQPTPDVHNRIARALTVPLEALHWPDLWPLPQPPEPPPDPRWKQRANCKGMDINLFYPPERTPPHWTVIRACHDCPVRAHCYHTDAHKPPGQQHGIWGGADAHTRRNRRRRTA